MSETSTSDNSRALSARDNRDYAFGASDSRRLCAALTHNIMLLVRNLQSRIVPQISSPPEDFYVDGDARCRERLLARLPQLGMLRSRVSLFNLFDPDSNPTFLSAALGDVEYPHDYIACHTESPHMLRLKFEYMRENPQVWRTSATPEGTTREDSEGFLAEWMTRPT